MDRKKKEGIPGKEKSSLGSGFEEALPALRSFARGLCGDVAMADDLVQSACQRGLEKIDQLKDRGGLKSWLYRLVYTQWQDVLRERTRHQTKLYDFSRYLIQSGRDQGERNEQRSISRMDLKRGLAILSPEHRAALLLVSMQGYSYEEASVILDLPVGTVASRVARARTMLAGWIKRNSQVSMDQRIAAKEEASS